MDFDPEDIFPMKLGHVILVPCAQGSCVPRTYLLPPRPTCDTCLADWSPRTNVAPGEGLEESTACSIGDPDAPCEGYTRRKGGACSGECGSTRRAKT